MLVKKRKSYTIYLKFLALIAFIVLVFVFRAKLTNAFVNAYDRFFGNSENAELTLSEREELGVLRAENNVLRDENKKVREAFSVGDIEDTRALVYMLLGKSSIYGSFYTSLPMGKTPYVGMNIFAPDNVVVGQVDEILPNSMKIGKLGQDRTFIASSLENEESVELQSLGMGLYYGKVSGGSKISLGDTIVLKGYPKAIVGTVVEVQKGDTSLSNIFVRTPYNINNKEIFYVIQ